MQRVTFNEMARSASLVIALLQKQKEQQATSKDVRAFHKPGRTQGGASVVGIQTSKGSALHLCHSIARPQACSSRAARVKTASLKVQCAAACTAMSTSTWAGPAAAAAAPSACRASGCSPSAWPFATPAARTRSWSPRRAPAGTPQPTASNSDLPGSLLGSSTREPRLVEGRLACVVYHNTYGATSQVASVPAPLTALSIAAPLSAPSGGRARPRSCIWSLTATSRSWAASRAPTRSTRTGRRSSCTCSPRRAPVPIHILQLRRGCKLYFACSAHYCRALWSKESAAGSEPARDSRAARAAGGAGGVRQARRPGRPGARAAAAHRRPHRGAQAQARRAGDEGASLRGRLCRASVQHN